MLSPHSGLLGTRVRHILWEDAETMVWRGECAEKHVVGTVELLFKRMWWDRLELVNGMGGPRGRFAVVRSREEEMAGESWA